MLDFIRVPTQQLKKMVEHYSATLPKEQLDELIAEIRSAFEKYAAMLGAYHPGIERAMLAQRLLSTAMTASYVAKSTCAKGCGACCHLEVEITKDEGDLLAVAVRDKAFATPGFEVDQKRLELQASRARMDAAWAERTTAINRCVFLGADQACQVYDYRPSICRKHIVASHPTECSKAEGAPTPILVPYAEVILSAALSQPGNSKASLSQNLLASLVERGLATRSSVVASEDQTVVAPTRTL